MCNRIVALGHDEAEEVVRRIELGAASGAVGGLEARGHALPGDEVPVIVPGPRTGGQVGPRLLTTGLVWGFDVDWKSGLVFNTRIESALSGRRMWADSIRDGRCVVPTFGFCETHATEKARDPSTGRTARQRYLFTMADGSPLVYLAAVRSGGRFSVVTTAANRSVLPVHGRMPIVLREEEIRVWMGPSFASLAARDDVALRARPLFVSRDVPPDGGDAQLSLF